jgi:hypothetical protein
MLCCAVAVALLDEKRAKPRTRDFTLLVGSSFFHGGRKCVVRASTANELLLAVLAALESQGVHIPQESFPLQVLHRDAEFKESLPVLDLDMLHDKARVRLEQQQAEALPATGAADAADDEAAYSYSTADDDREEHGLPAAAAAADSAAATSASPAPGLAASPGPGHSMSMTVTDEEMDTLRRTLQEAEERAAAAATLQEKCDALSDSLAAVRTHTHTHEHAHTHMSTQARTPLTRLAALYLLSLAQVRHFCLSSATALICNATAGEC